MPANSQLDAERLRILLEEEKEKNKRLQAQVSAADGEIRNLVQQNAELEEEIQSFGDLPERVVKAEEEASKLRKQLDNMGIYGKNWLGLNSLYPSLKALFSLQFIYLLYYLTGRYGWFLPADMYTIIGLLTFGVWMYFTPRPRPSMGAMRPVWLGLGALALLNTLMNNYIQVMNFLNYLKNR